MIKAGNWVNVIINVEDGKVVHNRIAKCHKHRNGLVHYFNGDRIVYAIEENVEKLPIKFKGFEVNKNGQVSELRRIRGYEHTVQFVCTDDGFAAYSYFKVGTLFMSMGNKECGTPGQAKDWLELQYATMLAKARNLI